MSTKINLIPTYFFILYAKGLKNGFYVKGLKNVISGSAFKNIAKYPDVIH